MHDDLYTDRARGLLKARGARVTAPRVAVLAALLPVAEQASDPAATLSHQEVAARLEDVALDRVTLYRVLDWLVEIGIAHRVAGEDRVFRFGLNASVGAHASRHGHFHCTECRRVWCLGTSSAISAALEAALPDGFVGEDVALAVRGRCAQCAVHH